MKDKVVDNQTQPKDPVKEDLKNDQKQTGWTCFSLTCNVVIPMLVLVISYLAYPIFFHKSILGKKVDFANCQVKRYDALSDSISFTNETIEIHTVDYNALLVEAETLDGAAYGLGFAHAKDRLWQLNFYRHLSQGRMGELVGALGFEIDRLIRTVGLPRAAQLFIDKLPKEELIFLENYSSGINKVAENIQVYPPEFNLFWVDFEEWTPYDSASNQMLIGFVLANDPFNELIRQRLLEVYDRELVEKILPMKKEDYYQFEHMETINEEMLAKIDMLESEDFPQTLYQMDDDLMYFTKEGQKQKTVKSDDKSKRVLNDLYYQDGSLNPSGPGSNCWAISGEHTQRGKPLMACDPHLAKGVLSNWHLTRVRWNETDSETGEEYRTHIVGHSIVGAPTFSYFRTPFASFGITSLCPDIMDIFAEVVSDDGSQYFDPIDQEFKDFTIVKEVIKTRFQDKVELELKFTRNGVIIPHDLLDKGANDLMMWVPRDVFPPEELREKNRVYSMAWVYDPMIQRNLPGEPQPLKANLKHFMGISARKELVGKDQGAEYLIHQIKENISFPGNLMIALENGEIGFTPSGLFPVRNSNVIQGMFVKKGEKKENVWQGVISSIDLPYAINPESGFLISANNWQTSARAKYGIGLGRSMASRYIRIREMIEDKIEKGIKMNVDFMKAMQLDNVDIQARTSLPDMIACVERGLDTPNSHLNQTHVKLAQFGLSHLKKWDATFNLESTAASIFDAWEFQIATFLHETTIDSVRLRRSLINYPGGEQFLFKSAAEWAKETSTLAEHCHVKELGRTNSCQEFMAYTLAKACEVIKSRLGQPKDNSWSLGNLETVRYNHTPMSAIPPLKSYFEIVNTHAGGRRSINAQGWFFHNEKEQFVNTYGALTRSIVDFAEPTSAFFSSAADNDQSKLNSTPTSSRGSLVDLWQKDRYFRFPTNEIADQIRFKLRSEGKTLFLHPGENTDRPEEAPKGCPFA